MGREWAEGMVGDLAPCAIHRNVETHLRCSRCGTSICPKCLVSTATGAQCPRCGQAGGRRAGGPNPLRAPAGGALGFGVGMAGGAVLVFIPFGALLALPLLLLGVVVGEVVAATAGRPGGLALALEGFLCALFGPLAGRALMADVLGGSGPAAASGALASSADALGAFGLLLLGVGAVAGGVRAASRRG